MNPRFTTVLELARSADESLCWIVGERGFIASRLELEQLEAAIELLTHILRSLQLSRRRG